GLWSLPEMDALPDLHALAERHGLQLGEPRALPAFTHTFSPFQLSIEPWLVPASSRGGVMAEGDWLWYNLSAPAHLDLAATVKKMLRRVAEDSLAELSCPAPCSAASTKRTCPAWTARHIPATRARTSSTTCRRRPGKSGRSIRPC